MNRIGLLDYGRFIAALGVVLFHYTFNGINNGKISSLHHIEPVSALTKYGYLGVEFFFMISGYVIFYSALRRSAAEFAVSRAIRLYPLYWTAVIWTTLWTIALGGDTMSVYPGQVITNLTLFHTYLGYNHVDGVYWTLIFELKFYLAVLAVLFFSSSARLVQLFVLWPWLLLLARLSGLESYTFLGGYYCYFSAGTLFALVKHSPSRYRYAGLILSFLLCLDYSCGNAAFLAAGRNTTYSEWVIAVMICVFFLFFFVANLSRIQNTVFPLSRQFGALTYPVYLVHAHFGYILLSHYVIPEHQITGTLFVVLVVLATAWVMHKIIEVKLAPWWHSLFQATLGYTLAKAQHYIPKEKDPSRPPANQ